MCVSGVTGMRGYAPTMSRKRLDAVLAERGLFETRTRAAAAVLAGDVRLGDERRRAEKPGQMVADDVSVEVADRPRFVSRGGQKLENALIAFGLDPADDAGASTGGFTDCLLQRGARHVVAVDVGYGELDWRLRNDERVTVIERRNARELTPAELAYRPDLVVADLSFISLTKVLPRLLDMTAAAWDCIALVKPQFEVWRERVGKGGVVRSPDDRRAALVAIGEWAVENGCAVMGYASSGLPGPAGNEESFVWIAEGGRVGAVESVEAAAREVEP
jgi:23S rRNA (cytidine1920-2'-O)/16S rRNA (cytidine1409-2'-O)-methyltransferase